jgi:hypothetical protein
VRTKKDSIRTTSVKGHHNKIATKKEVKSAGRYTVKKGTVKTYSKSYGFNVTPKKGDAKLIKRKVVTK